MEQPLEMLSRPGWILLSWAVAAACVPAPVSPGRERETDTRHTTIAAQRSRRLLQGELLTFKGGRVVGVDKYRDDGDELSSTVRLGTQQHRVVLSRSKRTVSCDGSPPAVLPDDALALENGHWQAYAAAAERFASATTARPVRVVLPCSGLVLDATIRVTESESGRRVVLRIGQLSSEVVIDHRGAVSGATVPVQDIEVRQASSEVPITPPIERSAPAGVEESAITIHRGDVELRGVAWIPRGTGGQVPIALLIAGSGPTDRDGNSVLGIHCDAYRLLAADLAARGVATVRYDKRGVGESGRNFAADALVIGDFVEDARAWIQRIREDARFGELTLIGHSEGGLIATLAAKTTGCDALVLIASVGRTFDAVVREQVAHRAPSSVADYDRIVSALRSAKPLPDVPAALAPIFNPAGLAFFKSTLDVDPAAELRMLQDCPVTVVQGTSDVQVLLDDAKALARARPSVRLHVVEHMNHVLKEEAEATPVQQSYTDPGRPLAPGLIDAVLTGIAR